MLSGGNEEAAFSLSSSGQLSLTQTLDREARGSHLLLVTATDSGEPRIPQLVAIRVVVATGNHGNHSVAWGFNDGCDGFKVNRYMSLDS